ncbi:MAG: succinylglutamate desuccinylase/aspartoacylase family protein [Dehalococcoidia bacterium]
MSAQPADQPVRPALLSRRRVLTLAGGALLATACGGGRPPQPSPASAADDVLATPSPAPTSTPTPTPTPRPVPRAGREVRTLLPGAEYETTAVITHSGVEGPRVLVLGGVHGNEPGGWMAAEAIAEWTVTRGSLVVVPRANILATYAFQRTLDGFGDLNRMYPGAVDGLPMARMAHAIVQLAREVDTDLLIDLHESWGFWNERTGDQGGTAFIGQTVTTVAPPAPRAALAETITRVNTQLTEREQLVFRDRNWGRRRRPFGGMDPDLMGFGASSLSLGDFVSGVTPILVEVGQRDQLEDRRAEIHRTIVGALLGERAML